MSSRGRAPANRNRCAAPVSGTGVALFLPGCSARKALLVGWRQHSVVPGPNSGWSEAAVAGALQRRLIGPIWQDGTLVTDLWLGHAGDPEGGRPEDLRRTCALAIAACLAATGLSALFIAMRALGSVSVYFPRPCPSQSRCDRYRALVGPNPYRPAYAARFKRDAGPGAW